MVITDQPINEIVAGILALLMWGGTFLLLVLSRPIPEIVSAGDLAVITFFLSTHSFNSGVEHGIKRVTTGLNEGTIPP